MLKIIKSSVRDTLIYGLGTFTSKLTGLILVPLYTSGIYLSENDYGVLNLVEANIQFIISVFGLGLSYAFERWYWDKTYLNERKTILFTILLTTFSTGLLVIVVMSSFSIQLSNLLFESSGYSNIVSLMALCAGLELFSQTPNSLIRLKERPTLFTIANVAKLVVSLSLNVLLLVQFEMGLISVYYAQLAGIAVYFLILGRFIIANAEIGFQWEVLKDMLRFRLPLVLPIVALNIFSFNDRYVLSNLVGLTDAGIYSLGYKLANTIKVFMITAIWLALMPTIYKVMNDPNNKRFYSKVMTYLSYVVMVAVICLSTFSKELIMIFSNEAIYMEAYKIIPIISLGIFFGLLKDISMIGLNVTKKTTFVGITTLVITIINLGSNVLLVSRFGIVGAGLANLASQFLFFIVIYWYAQRQYPIPYEVGKVFSMVVFGIGLYLLSYFGTYMPVWLSPLYKIALIFSFPFILRIAGFYEQVELDRMMGFWRKWKDPSKWRANFENLDF